MTWRQDKIQRKTEWERETEIEREIEKETQREGQRERERKSTNNLLFICLFQSPILLSIINRLSSFSPFFLFNLS